MKKTRSFLLTAGIALAMAFTLSCSDDKENNTGGGDGGLNGSWSKNTGAPQELKIDGGSLSSRNRLIYYIKLSSLNLV